MAAPNLVQSSIGIAQYNTGVSSVTTDPINTSNGNTFFGYVGLYDDAPLSGGSADLSDNKSNSYVWAQVQGAGSSIPLIEYTDYPGGGVRPAICYAGNGGTGHTTTSTFALGDEGSLMFVEMSDVSYIQDHQQLYRGLDTTIVSPTATATGACVAIATMWGLLTDTTLSVDSGFTIIEHWNAVGGTSIQCAMAAKVMASGGSASCTWTIDPPQQAIATMTIFQGTGGSEVTRIDPTGVLWGAMGFNF